ncbi:hypothetical protein OIO90_002141 [Microbotryomycetes sp. JL221]|nr:hypothetical protein OIO90_002141 [Microbotryomycetes sp. JL221]
MLKSTQRIRHNISNDNDEWRLAVAQSLLKFISTSTSAILERRATIITSIATKHLSATSYNSSVTTTSQRWHLTSTWLKLERALISRISTLTSTIVDDVVHTVKPFIFFARPLGSSTSSRDNNRGRVAMTKPATTKLNTNTTPMGSFVAPTSIVSSRQSTRAASRSSSISSLSRWSDMGVNGQDDHQRLEQRRIVQTRLDALSCLQAIATNDPRLLYKHWSEFFVDSPFQRYRPNLMALVERDPSHQINLKASIVVELMLTRSAQYLAVAQDRSTKASFTSLSSRIGEIIKELHFSLTSLLSSPNFITRQTVVVQHVLEIVKQLTSQTPYARLSNLTLHPLVEAVMSAYRLTDDSSIADIAVQTLVAQITNIIEQDCQSKINIESIVKFSNSILTFHEIAESDSNSSSKTRQAGAWTLLGFCMNDECRIDDVLGLVSKARQGFETIVEEMVQQARMSFICSILENNILSRHILAIEQAQSDQRNKSQRIVRLILEIIQLGINCSSPRVRTIACRCLSFDITRYLEETTFHYDDQLNMAIQLCKDIDSQVRNSACRSIGLIVKFTTFKPGDNQLVKAIQTLSSKCYSPRLQLLDRQQDSKKRDQDDVDILKNVASWALANCTDEVKISVMQHVNIQQLTSIAINLVMQSSNERTQTSGVRITGNLLRLLLFWQSETVEQFQSQQDVSLTVGQLVDVLCHGLRVTSAKVRWNSATAIQIALSNYETNHKQLMILTMNDLLKLINSMQFNLSNNAIQQHDDFSIIQKSNQLKPNYKVQLQTVKALSSVKNSLEQMFQLKIDSRDELKKSQVYNDQGDELVQMIDKLFKLTRQKIETDLKDDRNVIVQIQIDQVTKLLNELNHLLQS